MFLQLPEVDEFMCFRWDVTKNIYINVKFSITFITSADDHVAHLIPEQLSYIIPVCLMTTWHHFLENRWVEKSFKKYVFVAMDAGYK